MKQIYDTQEQLPIQLRSLTANSLLDASADLLDSTLWSMCERRAAALRINQDGKELESALRRVQ